MSAALGSSNCGICRRRVHAGQGTLFQAFGRPLFIAHTECVPVVHAGVRLVGTFALFTGREALRYRAPKAFAAVEATRLLVQKLGALGAPQAPHPHPPHYPPQEAPHG